MSSRGRMCPLRALAVSVAPSADLRLREPWRRADSLAGLSYNPEISVDFCSRAIAVFRESSSDTMGNELTFSWDGASECAGYCLVRVVVTEDDDALWAQRWASASLVSFADTCHVVQLLSSSAHDTASDPLAEHGAEELTDASLPLLLPRDQDACSRGIVEMEKDVFWERRILPEPGNPAAVLRLDRKLHVSVRAHVEPFALYA